MKWLVQLYLELARAALPQYKVRIFTVNGRNLSISWPPHICQMLSNHVMDLSLKDGDVFDFLRGGFKVVKVHNSKEANLKTLYCNILPRPMPIS